MLRALFRLVLLALVIAGAIQLGIGLFRDDLPGEGSADVGFARDMRVHHQQAVEMADLVRDRTADEDLKVVAQDISHTQTAQIGQMRGWLDVWELAPTSTGPPMAWAHAGDTEMPGMASEAEIQELEQATGQQAEVIFLRLMIRHHEGGVHMAETATRLVEEPEVLALARTIGESQLAEIRYLKALLDAREAEPLPSLLPPDTAGLGEADRSEGRLDEARDFATDWWLVGVGGLALVVLVLDLLRRPRPIPAVPAPVATVAAPPDERADRDDDAGAPADGDERRDDDQPQGDPEERRDDDIDAWLRGDV